jgi:hypothetical protein
MAVAASTEDTDTAVRELTTATVEEDSPRATTEAVYLAFRSAVLDPLRLSDGLRVRSYDVSLVVDAMVMRAQALAPDPGPG